MMQLYKTQEGAETWDKNGNISQYDLKYYVSDATSKQDAMKAVWADSPATYEGVPRSSIRFDSWVDDNNCEITVSYQKSSSSSSPGQSDDTDGGSSFTFDCGGGSKHVVRSLTRQRQIKGTVDPGLFIDWNGKTGNQSEIKGVEVPEAQLRETYVKNMKPSRLTTKWRKRIADLVGCVNASAFKGWQRGEVMFLGCSFSGNTEADDVIPVSFNFMIQPNEDSVVIADGVPAFSKEGFEYPWVITRPTDRNGIRTVDVTDVFVAQVCPYRDFSALGL